MDTIRTYILYRADGEIVKAGRVAQHQIDDEIAEYAPCSVLYDVFATRSHRINLVDGVPAVMDPFL